MSDAILLIWANGQGEPFTGHGRIGHFVRVASNPNLTVVNEFSDGGAFPHSDCGPACTLSTLADRGQHPTARDVEIADTTGAKGTTLEGVSNGLGHFGVTNTWQRGEPSPGWIMNPAGGRILPPSEFPAYRAASQGYVVTITAPDPWAQPSTGDPDVFPLYQRINGSVYLVCGGTLVTLGGPADIQYYLGLGSKTILEADLTVAARSHMNLLPVL